MTKFCFSLEHWAPRALGACSPVRVSSFKPGRAVLAPWSNHRRYSVALLVAPAGERPVAAAWAGVVPKRDCCGFLVAVRPLLQRRWHRYQHSALCLQLVPRSWFCWSALYECLLTLFTFSLHAGVRSVGEQPGLRHKPVGHAGARLPGLFSPRLTSTSSVPSFCTSVISAPLPRCLAVRRFAGVAHSASDTFLFLKLWRFFALSACIQPNALLRAADALLAAG